MTTPLNEVEAKYAQQLIAKTSPITEQELTALASMHRANVERDNAVIESETEKSRIFWDFMGKIGAALVAGGFAAGINAATRKDARQMMAEVSVFEETGVYTSSQGKGLIRKYLDCFTIK